MKLKLVILMILYFIIIDPKSVWNLLSYSFYERMPHQWRVREGGHLRICPFYRLNILRRTFREDRPVCPNHPLKNIAFQGLQKDCK